MILKPRPVFFSVSTSPAAPTLSHPHPPNMIPEIHHSVTGHLSLPETICFQHRTSYISGNLSVLGKPGASVILPVNMQSFSNQGLHVFCISKSVFIFSFANTLPLPALPLCKEKAGRTLVSTWLRAPQFSNLTEVMILFITALA